MERRSTPLIEYPPIEPVEPPATAPPPAPAPAPAPTQTPTPTPAEPAAAPPPTVVTEVPPEMGEGLAVLADLQRYGTLSPDDVKRELTTSTQALTRQRTDANRVRLAVLYSLTKNSPQDDQRAPHVI